MRIKSKEVKARTVLTKTGIPGFDYCINPYTGCTHACRYCYADFMKRFTGHTEPWGSFVDIKINAPEILRRQLKRAKRGSIIIGSVTDPYQPAEAEYNLTRKCLEVLEQYQFPVNILTKSPLVTRDIDIISRIKDAEVGLTITTDNDKIREIFEPGAPPIAARIESLKKLHKAGINTYVFIGPVLPMDTESLTGQIRPFIKRALIDRMNYSNKTKWIYRKHNMDKWLEKSYTDRKVSSLQKNLRKKDPLSCY